jgi:hypothetical protein
MMMLPTSAPERRLDAKATTLIRSSTVGFLRNVSHSRKRLKADCAIEVHDRMPVLLAEDQFEPWRGAAGVELLKPAPDDMLQRWPVSKRVNSSRAPADDPTLIEPVELATAGA